MCTGLLFPLRLLLHCYVIGHLPRIKQADYTLEADFQNFICHLIQKIAAYNHIRLKMTIHLEIRQRFLFFTFSKKFISESESVRCT